MLSLAQRDYPQTNPEPGAERLPPNQCPILLGRSMKTGGNILNAAWFHSNSSRAGHFHWDTKTCRMPCLFGFPVCFDCDSQLFLLGLPSRLEGFSTILTECPTFFGRDSAPSRWNQYSHMTTFIRENRIIHILLF